VDAVRQRRKRRLHHLRTMVSGISQHACLTEQKALPKMPCQRESTRLDKQAQQGAVIHLGVIQVGDAMCHIQEHWDAIAVAGSAGLRERLQQVAPASWCQRGQLKSLQCMPCYLVAVPVRGAQ
jgi:hypothetical protein